MPGSCRNPIELISAGSSVHDSIVQYKPLRKGVTKKPPTRSHYYGKNDIDKNCVIDVSKISPDL